MRFHASHRNLQTLHRKRWLSILSRLIHTIAAEEQAKLSSQSSGEVMAANM